MVSPGVEPRGIRAQAALQPASCPLGYSQREEAGGEVQEGTVRERGSLRSAGLQVRGKVILLCRSCFACPPSVALSFSSHFTCFDRFPGVIATWSSLQTFVVHRRRDRTTGRSAARLSYATQHRATCSFAWCTVFSYQNASPRGAPPQAKHHLVERLSLWNASHWA